MWTAEVTPNCFVVRDHNEQQPSLRIPIYAVVARRTDFKIPRSLFCRIQSLSEAYIILRRTDFKSLY
jgi:hypothetical protein